MLTYKQSGDSKSKTEKVQAHLQTIWRQQIQDRKGTSSPTNNLETANPRQKRYKLTYKQSGDSKYKTEKVQAHLQTIWTDCKSKTEQVQAHLQTIWRQQIQDRKGTSSPTNNLETANTRQKRYKLTYKQSGDSKYKTEKVQAHSSSNCQAVNKIQITVDAYDQPCFRRWLTNQISRDMVNNGNHTIKDVYKLFQIHQCLWNISVNNIILWWLMQIHHKPCITYHYCDIGHRWTSVNTVESNVD